MSSKNIDELGDLQRAVMEVLWQGREGTVQEVRDRLPGRRTPAYTTILSVLQKLEKFGWVQHRSAGRSYVYSASRSRGEEGSRTLRNFVVRGFGGEPSVVLQHLLKDERLAADDLIELQRLIDARRKGLGEDA
jgi:predicted transcriptional regulator